MVFRQGPQPGRAASGRRVSHSGFGVGHLELRVLYWEFPKIGDSR